MKYTIKVTEEDIEKGLRWSFQECPAALGMKRALEGSGYLLERMGSFSFIYAKGKKTNIYCEYSKEVAAKILKYDVKGEMEPFEFEVEIP